MAGNLWQSRKMVVRGIARDFRPNSVLYDWDRTTLEDYYGDARERMAALLAAHGRSPQGDLSPVVEPQFLHDADHVFLDGQLAQPESGGDLLVTGGLGSEQLNDLDLAGA